MASGGRAIFTTTVVGAIMAHVATATAYISVTVPALAARAARVVIAFLPPVGVALLCQALPAEVGRVH